jgi:uncharacterized protein
MTFHPRALDLLGNVRQAFDLGAPAVMLCPVVEAEWRGHEQALEEAYDVLADFYIEEARKGRILSLEMTNNLLIQQHALVRGGSRPPRPCNVGTALIGVDPDGHVLPCHRFLYRPQDRIGTVDQPVFDEKRWQYVHLSSSDIIGCDDCLARGVCGGGCRAVALASGRSLYEAHPGHCVTMRAHVRAMHRIYDTLTAENNLAFQQFLASARPLDPVMAELGMR